ncbi:sialin-like [Penaeus monodon]|uniref:sialin-like n=1 Tax=Penaeus monodon TaxID=6687 RepID=UPI0018A6FC26|nr:sialin-like [Penaeus monodon]
MTFSGGSALTFLESLDAAGRNRGQGEAAGGGGRTGSDGGGGGADNAGNESRGVDDRGGAEGEKPHIIYHISGEDMGENVHKESDTADGGCWGARYTLCLLLFLGITLIYMTRVCLSIAIVAMAGTSVGANNSSTNICPYPAGWNDTVGEAQHGEFDWDETTQGLILGSFFYGYVGTNFVGGRAAELLGGRLVLGLGVVLSSLLTVVSPLCAYASKELFIANRVLQGLAQGVTFPTIHMMMATWIPPRDRARIGTMVFSGVMIGTVVAMSGGGWLSNSDFLGGWPSVFYIFGGLGAVWGVPWFLLVHDRPEHHPRISRAEMNYIRRHQTTVKREEKVAIPWLDILKSVPFWSLMIAALGYNYGFYTLLTELPTYLSNIQHLDMASSGFMSALPYLVMMVATILWGQLMHLLLSADKISVLMVRKVSTAVCMYVPMAALVVMCFVNCDAALALAVLCVAVGASGTNYSGVSISEQDIAPNLAGTLKGITNTVGAATGIVAPMVTGAITQGNQTLAAWRIVFLISAALYFLVTSVYLAFATDKVQPWNFPKTEKDSRRF